MHAIKQGFDDGHEAERFGLHQDAEHSDAFQPKAARDSTACSFIHEHRVSTQLGGQRKGFAFTLMKTLIQEQGGCDLSGGADLDKHRKSEARKSRIN